MTSRWESPRFNPSETCSRLSKVSTFSASFLRDSNATLYLCIGLDDVRKYASILRVIIGQTLHALFRVKPESGALPVTFFLDELPRLGHMDVIEQGLDMGRGFGVRLWLFCQNSGQLASAYRNADGMTGNCAARCYMNPDEDTARWISNNLGTREGLLDGHRKPLAEASQLTGPEFADKIVVFLRGHPPARLDKRPAYADPVCRKRMSGEPVSPAPQAPPPAVVAPAIVVHAPEPTTPAASPAQQSWSGEPAISAQPELDQPKPVAAPPVDPGMVAEAPALPPSQTDWRRWAAPVIISAAALVWTVVVFLQLETTRSGEASAILARNEARDALQRAEAAAQAARTSLASERGRLNTQITSLQQQLAQAQGAVEAHRQDAARVRQELASLNVSIAERNRVPPQWEPQPAPPVAAPQAAVPPAPRAEAISASQVAERDACDQLAGNRYDPRWPGEFPGASFRDVQGNATQAIAACERASRSIPGEPRMKYQLARALQAANQNDRAFPLLAELANTGYPAAYDNLGFHYMRLRQVENAIAYHRKGADAGDPEAMVTVAALIEKGTARPRGPNEFWVLLQNAAQLGHEGARKTLQEKQAAGALIQRIPDIVRDVFRR